MRVHVYKHDEGRMVAVIEPTPGKGRPPVLVPGITTENVREKVLPEIVAMRAPRVPRQRQLP